MQELVVCVSKLTERLTYTASRTSLFTFKSKTYDTQMLPRLATRYVLRHSHYLNRSNSWRRQQ